MEALVILLSCLVRITLGSFEQNALFKICPNRRLETNMTSHSKVSSLVECGEKCMSDNTSNSANFIESSQICEIYESDVSQMQCDQLGYSERRTVIIKESNPCKNNQPFDGTRCVCSPPLYGEFCEQGPREINECDSAPCENNGTCVVDKDNDYFCNCTAGFKGRNCSIASCPTDSGYLLWTYPDMELCIRYSSASVSNYIDAGDQCSSTGGHLVLIENHSMRSHLVDIAHSYGISTMAYTYLNGRRGNSALPWIDWKGDEVNWLSWAPASPSDGKCLISKVDGDFYHFTGHCTYQLSYLLCQFDI